MVKFYFNLGDIRCSRRQSPWQRGAVESQGTQRYHERHRQRLQVLRTVEFV